MSSSTSGAAPGYPDQANPDLDRYWEGAEADWYPDPTVPGLIRYWDGSGWTDLVTPRPPALWSLGESAPGCSPTHPGAPTPRPAGRRAEREIVRRFLSRVARLRRPAGPVTARTK
jgi:hypothetical protein